jgi:hypothetical protein
MYAASRAMLRDRVRALREADVLRSQCYRHVLGTPLIVAIETGGPLARTSFMVSRVMRTGELSRGPRPRHVARARALPRRLSFSTVRRSTRWWRFHCRRHADGKIMPPANVHCV